MKLINDDLRELELRESNLFELFWSAETESGYDRLLENLRQRYRNLFNTLTEEQMRAVRAFVASTVVVGAVKGLEFGHALQGRQIHRRRRSRGKDGQIEIILKHKKVRDLLQKEPSVSTKEICDALDRLDIEMPWKALANTDVPDSRFWKAHAKAGVVKNTISRARKRVLEINSDIRYIKSFIRGQRLD